MTEEGRRGRKSRPTSRELHDMADEGGRNDENVVYGDSDSGQRLRDSFPEKTKVAGRHIVRDVPNNTLKVEGRTPNQKKFLENAFKNDVNFALAPAGTGKTFIAVYIAIEKLKAGLVDKIIITRPAVGGQEDLGFLPGDADEKMGPYMAPVIGHFEKILGDGDREKGYQALKKLRDNGTIEILPFAYMRGTDLEDAFVIGDEMQNATHEQVKMLLTRIGDGSQMLLVGDPEQTDLNPREFSGFEHAARTIQAAGIEGISVSEMTQEDIIRHPLIGPMLKALHDNPPQIPEHNAAPAPKPSQFRPS